MQGGSGWEDRRTAIAAGIVGGESLIFLGNRCRCPLTGMAQALGATRGSVTDIYLPWWLASNLVPIHVPLLALALYLHTRTFLRRSRARASVSLLNVDPLKCFSTEKQLLDAETSTS